MQADNKSTHEFVLRNIQLISQLDVKLDALKNDDGRAAVA